MYPDVITHLADSDRLSLVSKRETTQLGVVRETFYANGLCGLDESDNLLTLLRELRWFLRLPTCRLVEVVEQ